LLVTDPFSAVSVRVPAKSEDGVAEGRGLGRLTLNYLFPDSAVQIGDDVMTAGLGHIFPEGVFVGRVASLEDVSKETFFRRAVITPAVRLNNLHEVVIMLKKVREAGPPHLAPAADAPAKNRRPR
jgi:rod shape-determining protein MreC